MRSERRTVRCQHCGEDFSARVILQIDRARLSDREISLSDGAPFLFFCPHCGKESFYNHYLLWADEAHSVAVCNLTCEEEKEAVAQAIGALSSLGCSGTIPCRFVRSPSEFFEKTEIFSLGLDDRAVEILKLYFSMQVRQAHPQKQISEALFFRNGEEYGFLYRCPDGDLSVSVSARQLEQAAQLYSFSEQAPEVVDAQWALDYVMRRNAEC